MTTEQKRQKSTAADWWWIAAAILGAGALALANFAGNSGQRAAWVLYPAAWLPTIAGVVWCRKNHRSDKLRDVRQIVVFLIAAGGVLTLLHRDALPF
ncbi:hypothetical protein [Streptomyces sp. PanSC9]|uniref:hypothetical protein n=1 Tax=Streptomyces sp. PanSC9 TaxID=1520461 RepID=UPI0011CDBBD7|nr:hypothetical protein [Streptomyces sp. PanSC9]